MSVNADTHTGARARGLAGPDAHLQWACAARSDVGLRRSANEDRWLATAGLLAVADGVGGERAGELAATIAISELVAAAGRGGIDLAALMRAFHSANRTILALADRDTDRHGMATTLTAATLHDGAVGVVHVGDSRAYRLRNERLEALTQDHAFGGELVRSGLLTPQRAACHPMRSVLARSLGHSPGLQVDAWLQPVLPGDRYVLCSDGLTDTVSEAALAELVQHPELDVAADRLVAAALRSGGRDNVTVVLAQVEPGPRDASPRQRSVAS